jgi:hypothetical protein
LQLTAKIPARRWLAGIETTDFRVVRALLI